MKKKKKKAKESENLFNKVPDYDEGWKKYTRASDDEVKKEIYTDRR